MNMNEQKRELIEYEYYFDTTPRFKVVDEEWKLYDVFLKHLSNGASVFVPVFRKRVKTK